MQILYIVYTQSYFIEISSFREENLVNLNTVVSVIGTDM